MRLQDTSQAIPTPNNQRINKCWQMWFSLYVSQLQNIRWALLHKLDPKAGWSQNYLWQVWVRVWEKGRRRKGGKLKWKQSHRQKHPLPAVSSYSHWQFPPGRALHPRWPRPPALPAFEDGSVHMHMLSHQWMVSPVPAEQNMSEKHIRVEMFAANS